MAARMGASPRSRQEGWDKPGPSSPDDGTFHKERSDPSEHAPIIDREQWDMVQARLAGNDAQRGADGRIA
jgi:hypothetical protein